MTTSPATKSTFTEVRTSARARAFNKPAYRYLRASDGLPRFENLPDSDDVLCRVKLFNPTGAGTWWIAAYNPESGVAYGVAEIFDREIGSFYIPELVEFRGQFGLPIERDLYYTPTTIRDILA